MFRLVTPSKKEDLTESSTVFAISSKESGEPIETAYERDVVSNVDDDAVEPSAFAPADALQKFIQLPPPQRVRATNADGGMSTNKSSFSSSSSSKFKKTATTAASFFAKSAAASKTSSSSTAAKSSKSKGSSTNSSKSKSSSTTSGSKGLFAKAATTKSVDGKENNKSTVSSKKKEDAKKKAGDDDEKVGNADDFVGDLEDTDDEEENDNDVSFEGEGRERSSSAKDDDDAPSPAKKQKTKKAPAVPVHGAMDDFCSSGDKPNSTSADVGASTSGNRIRKRRKKMVEKTYMQNGYLKTETQVVWEDIPTDEEEEEAAKTSSSITSSLMKSSAGIPSRKTNKTAKKPQEMKQKSLMGFFAKK